MLIGMSSTGRNLDDQRVSVTRLDVFLLLRKPTWIRIRHNQCLIMTNHHFFLRLPKGPKLLSWARQPNTIDVGNFGPPNHAPHASQGQLFFKHKYLTNPSITPEDQVIAAAAHLKDTLEGIRSPQLQTSTLKSLGDLQDIFH